MPGLLRGMARTAVVAGTATAVVGGVSRRQQRRWQAQDADAAEAAAPAEETAPDQPQEDDMSAQLEQLATLRDKGILTDEEFSAKKKQVLGI